MINQIQTVITALSTFPDRPNYESARKYAKAVATWLRENKELSEALATLIPELNTVLEQINSTTQNIQDIEERTEQLKEETQAFKEATQEFKNLVENISASLVEGSINNTTIGETSTYSSFKIEDLLNLKADKTEVELNKLEKTASIETTIEINPKTSLFYSVLVDANVSFSFTGYNTERMQQIIVELENAGSWAVTFNNVKWVKLDGTFATTIAEVGLSLQETGKDYLLFFSPNGTDIIGKVLR